MEAPRSAFVIQSSHSRAVGIFIRDDVDTTSADSANLISHGTFPNSRFQIPSKALLTERHTFSASNRCLNLRSADPRRERRGGRNVLASGATGGSITVLGRRIRVPEPVQSIGTPPAVPANVSRPRVTHPRAPGHAKSPGSRREFRDEPRRDGCRAP